MDWLIILVAMLGLMWLLLIRPQKRRQSKQSEMLGNLEVGDEILTVGGVYARIAHVGDDELMVEIAPGTRVRLDKRAVATVVPPEEAVQQCQ